MPLTIRDPELFGVTEASVTLAFSVEYDTGPADDAATIRLNGEVRATSDEATGTRLVRIENLEPATTYDIAIEVTGAPAPARDAYFPERFRTLPAPRAAHTASFATMNDLHFGESRFGGAMGEMRGGGDIVGDTGDGAPAYWQFMNEDAIRDINMSGVELTVIKGDIADRGLGSQFEAAARAFAGFEAPHEAFLGNHDYYGSDHGESVDGYAVLGQQPAPRTVEFGGWRLVLVDTVETGRHRGALGPDRLAWLEQTLREPSGRDMPTLLLMHHQPVPPAHASGLINRIGIVPEHSARLFELVGRCAQVKGALIGHTHRNRVRRYAEARNVPFAEVHCTKDYPGGWAHYRLFEDGTFRQEARRTSSARALAHATRCARAFDGDYRRFAIGSLGDRSFATG